MSSIHTCALGRGFRVVQVDPGSVLWSHTIVYRWNSPVFTGERAESGEWTVSGDTTWRSTFERNLLESHICISENVGLAAPGIISDSMT